MPTSIPVCYVAGPFRGPNAWDIEKNIRQAEALAWDVWALGAAAVCPHANTRYFQNSLPDDVWLAGDLAMLAKCDAVIMTPDWRRSSGARAEHDFATAQHIPVFYTLGQLRAWMESRL